MRKLWTIALLIAGLVACGGQSGTERGDEGTPPDDTGCASTGDTGEPCRGD
jgi:hypothetical protein